MTKAAKLLEYVSKKLIYTTNLKKKGNEGWRQFDQRFYYLIYKVSILWRSLFYKGSSDNQPDSLGNCKCQLSKT